MMMAMAVATQPQGHESPLGFGQRSLYGAHWFQLAVSSTTDVDIGEAEALVGSAQSSRTEAAGSQPWDRA